MPNTDPATTPTRHFPTLPDQRCDDLPVPDRLRRVEAMLVGVVVADAQRLEVAEDPAEIREIEAQDEAIEQYMKSAGLYPVEKIRPVNETRMRARWKLGRALAKAERGNPGPNPKKDTSRPGTYFRKMLTTIGLNKNRAVEAQRIGTLPPPELDKALSEARQRDDLLHYNDLIVRARPYPLHGRYLDVSRG